MSQINNMKKSNQITTVNKNKCAVLNSDQGKIKPLQRGKKLLVQKATSSTRYSSMSMSSGLIRRSLARASRMILMALQEQCFSK